MSTSNKLDTSIKSNPSQPIKKEKNIREIYLQALNKGFHKTGNKKSFTNLTEERNGSSGSSNFLEKEYNIVQRIISDTKELKKVKDTGKKEPMSRRVAAHYKDPEEYCEEILELKKMLKIFEENELVNRTKFEYYENELTKKEQEILDLLDVKKNDELRFLAESKSDLATLVYGLKQKVFKLEFSLKRKENEFNKLKNDIKTTNMKEMKIQNERLRLELSKALMSDKSIIETFEKESAPDPNGLMEKSRSESQMSLAKKEIQKKNMALFVKSANKQETNAILPKLGNYESKMALSGSIKEKLEQLDQRETELLNEIFRLNSELEKFKKNDIRKNKDSDSETESFANSVRSNRSSRASKRETSKENQLEAIKKLQSVMRGHLERSSSLKRAEKEKMDRRRSQSKSPSWRSMSSRDSSPRARSPAINKSKHVRRSPSPQSTPRRPNSRSSWDSSSINSPNKRRSVTPRKSWSSSDEESDYSFKRDEKQNDNKKLIENKNVEETDSTCCCGSSWKQKKK